MTREEHKKAIIENLNAMVDKLEDDNEYLDALYHLGMLCKEIEPCEDCISRKAVLDCNSKDVTYEVRHFKEDVECLPSIQSINQNIKALGEELRTFRGGIKDEKVLTGFNMAIALCNKHLADMRGTECPLNDYEEPKADVLDKIRVEIEKAV